MDRRGGAPANTSVNAGGDGTGDGSDGARVARRQGDATSTLRTRPSRQKQRRPRPQRERCSGWTAEFPVPSAVVSTLSRNKVLTLTTQAFWQHLYYTRGLSPIPAHQISLDANNQQQIPRRTLQVIDKIRNNVAALVHALDVAHVVVSLGTSCLRPKEVYRLDATRLFGEVSAIVDENQYRNGTNQEGVVSSKFLRCLLAAECDATSDASANASSQVSPSDQLYVTFGVSSNSFDQAFKETPSILSDAIVRHGLSLDGWASNKRLRRTGTVALRTKANEGTNSEEVSSLVWISLNTKLKGFR